MDKVFLLKVLHRIGFLSKFLFQVLRPRLLVVRMHQIDLFKFLVLGGQGFDRALEFFLLALVLLFLLRNLCLHLLEDF